MSKNMPSDTKVETKPSEPEAVTTKPDYSAFLKALAGVADPIGRRTAALIIAYAVTDLGAEAVHTMPTSEFVAYAERLRKHNPMAWGAARTNDVLRFSRITNAVREESKRVDAKEYQSSISVILAT